MKPVETKPRIAFVAGQEEQIAMARRHEPIADWIVPASDR
jgi:hypothetical protein